jgi:hypothetical protein
VTKGESMIAFPEMLIGAAEKAGIKVPPNPDEFERDDYMHFFVFSTVQIGAAMPYPGAPLDNAKMIAQISDEEIGQITYQELLDRGLAVGETVS